MSRADYMRMRRQDPAFLLAENNTRKARRRLDPERVAAADRRYNHSFRGVVRNGRDRDQQALARLEQQVREGIESL